MSKICIGVDIGGTTVKIGIFTKQGQVEKKWEIPTRKEEQGKYILSDVASSVKENVEQLGNTMEDVIGIGIGVPGPVVGERKVLECVNLGWGIIDVAEKMKELTGISNIKVGNDANIAALGEMWKGGGEGYHNIIMVTLGTGVGGGVIINGKILTGSNGAAGEIGHIVVNLEEEDACNCGKKGCLEQYASATGIVKEAKRALKATDRPSVLREVETISAKIVFDSAKDGDELAVELVNHLCKTLGIALAHIAQVVDPQAFVIGGGVSKAGEILTKNIEKYYNDFVMKALKGKDFCLATLGNDAGIFGSAKLILD